MSANAHAECSRYSRVLITRVKTNDRQLFKYGMPNFPVCCPFNLSVSYLRVAAIPNKFKVSCFIGTAFALPASVRQSELHSMAIKWPASINLMPVARNPARKVRSLKRRDLMVITRVPIRVARFVKVLVNGNYFIFRTDRGISRALCALFSQRSRAHTIRIARWF